MFKILKENKIIGVSENEPVLFDAYDVEEDTDHTVDDYEQYEGEYLLKEDIPAPTLEEQKEKRAQDYLIEVDPITLHIQRERDEENPDNEKIAALIVERSAKVEEIKKRYPYPEEKAESEELV